MNWTPDNYRHSGNGWLVRCQIRVDAIERFLAMTELWYNAGSFEAGLYRADNTMQTLNIQPVMEVKMSDKNILHGRNKVNPYQSYLSEDYRINADGLMVQNQAAKPTTPALKRFFDKVKVSETLTYQNEPCWEWQGCKSKAGYGQFRFDGRRGSLLSSPHRFAYEHFIDDIPDGHEIDHLCKVRHCCNPRHLEAITLQENRKRRNEAQTHCKHGHELSGDNLIQLSPQQSRRVCRACANNRAKAFRDRNPNYYKHATLLTRDKDAP